MEGPPTVGRLVDVTAGRGLTIGADGMRGRVGPQVRRAERDVHGARVPWVDRDARDETLGQALRRNLVPTSRRSRLRRLAPAGFGRQAGEDLDAVSRGAAAAEIAGVNDVAVPADRARLVVD